MQKENELQEKIDALTNLSARKAPCFSSGDVEGGWATDLWLKIPNYGIITQNESEN